MIINCSRAKVFHTCRRKAFNAFHRMCEGPRSMNLVDGGAFHDTVASGLATPSDKDWSRALVEGRKRFDAGVAAAPLLEEWQIEMHWQVVEKMAQIYRENYEKEDYVVIQPECSFDVELPGSYHNCIFIHHLELTDTGPVEKWGPPDPQAILEGRIRSPHEGLLSDYKFRKECCCWQPHRLVGKTDAIIKWRGMFWLMEHKTSAISGDQFWDQWDLDVQPTTYMYGIRRSLNLRLGGFVLDMIFKPSERQIEAWNAKRKYGPPKNVLDYMDYERRAFLRDDESLAEVEGWYIDTCNEWESRIAGPLAGQWPMSNVGHACKLYNRKCDFWTACLTHNDPAEFDALARRADDYVVEKLVKLLPAPQEVSNG